MEELIKAQPQLANGVVRLQQKKNDEDSRIVA
jgi:hypothetical protein